MINNVKNRYFFILTVVLVIFMITLIYALYFTTPTIKKYNKTLQILSAVSRVKQVNMSLANNSLEFDSMNKIVITCILLFLFIVFTGIKKLLISIKGIIRSIAVFFITVISSVLLTGVIYLFINWTEINQGFAANNIKLGNFLIIDFLIISFAIMLISIFKFSEKNNMYELHTGFLSIWALLLLISSLYLKEYIYLFIWPFLVGTFIIAYKLIFQGRNFGFFEAVIISTFIIIPSVILFAPVIYLIYLTRTISAVPELIILSVLAFSLIVSTVFMVLDNKNNMKIIKNKPFNYEK